MSKRNDIDVGWNIVDTDGVKTLEWSYIRGHNVSNTYRITPEEAREVKNAEDDVKRNEVLEKIVLNEKEKIRLAQEAIDKKHKKEVEEQKRLAEVQKKNKI